MRTALSAALLATRAPLSPEYKRRTTTTTLTLRAKYARLASQT